MTNASKNSEAKIKRKFQKIWLEKFSKTFLVSGVLSFNFKKMKIILLPVLPIRLCKNILANSIGVSQATDDKY